MEKRSLLVRGAIELRKTSVLFHWHTNQACENYLIEPYFRLFTCVDKSEPSDEIGKVRSSKLQVFCYSVLS